MKTSRKSRELRKAQNKSAIIRNRIDRHGKLRTETARRETGINAALSTDESNNSTNMFIDFGRERVKLSGREARTLYRLLQSHYDFTGKSYF